MPQVTLEQILSSREERVEIQRSLLCVHKCPVIVFTMNIAGPVKNSPLIKRAFFEGTKSLLGKIPSEKIISKEVFLKDTGCEMFVATDENPQILKRICVEIEETHPLGRIFDMDVTDTHGVKLSREKERGCIVCSSPGRYCSARRIHSAEEVWNATKKIMDTYFLKCDASLCAQNAAKSLIQEVDTTPKPGLVDRNNNGSHKDMNRHLFIQSARCLVPYFEKCFVLGAENPTPPYGKLFSLLKEAGLGAEKTMYETTKGINTHKGIIFSMGILCASMGVLWKPDVPFSHTADVLKICASIAKEKKLPHFARTENLCAKYNIGGIVKEAQSGFATVWDTGLPVYKNLLRNNCSENLAGAVTLIHLIAATDDTNLYYRGGKEGALWAKAKAKCLTEKYTVIPEEEIEKTDIEFIEKNLSPGGCADLLAITYFLHEYEKAKEILLFSM